MSAAFRGLRSVTEIPIMPSLLATKLERLGQQADIGELFRAIELHQMESLDHGIGHALTLEHTDVQIDGILDSERTTHPGQGCQRAELPDQTVALDWS